MKTLKFKRCPVGLFAALLAVGIIAQTTNSQARPLPPPSYTLKDFRTVISLVWAVEHNLPGTISLALVRVTSPSAVQIQRTLVGPKIQGPIVLPDANELQLGEYAVLARRTWIDPKIQETLRPSELELEAHVQNAKSPVLTAVERYNRLALIPNRAKASTQAIHIMQDRTEDPLVRQAAFQMVQCRSLAAPDAQTPMFHRAELEMLASPDLPDGLALAIMNDIDYVWSDHGGTPTEQSYAIRYLMAVVTRSHTRWKVMATFEPLCRFVSVKGPNITVYYTPEIRRAMEKRVACEAAGKSLYAGVVVGFTSPFDASKEEFNQSVAETWQWVNSIMSASGEHKIITHKLAPMPKDDLMRRLLAAAEK